MLNKTRIFDNQIGSNILYQWLYQFIVIGMPLVITPYLTRTLGANQLGEYTYNYTYAYYFIVLANLGIERNGQRIIAETQENIVCKRKAFWSVYIIHFAVSTVSLLIYCIFSIYRLQDDSILSQVFSIIIISTTFDVTWYYQGLEDFRTVARKNIIVEGLKALLILACVRHDTDVATYAIIISMSSLSGNIFLFSRAVKESPIIKVTCREAMSHLKPLLLLGLSSFAVSIYTVFDKTLLGLLLDKSNVSFYEYSNKIIKVPCVLLAVVPSVLFPRICRLMNQNETKSVNGFFSISVMLTALVGCGAIFILLSTADLFAPLFLGDEFSICSKIMKLLSPLILIIPLGDIIRNQVMIPKHKDKQFVFCLAVSAVINLALSWNFIKSIGVYGAIIGTLSAELLGFLLEIYFCKEEINLLLIIRYLTPFLLFGVFTLLATELMFEESRSAAVALLIKGVFAMIIYGALCILYIHFKKNEIHKIFEDIQLDG